MTALFLLFYLIAAVFFGLAAASVTTRRGLNFGWLGLLACVLVEILQVFQKL